MLNNVNSYLLMYRTRRMKATVVRALAANACHGLELEPVDSAWCVVTISRCTDPNSAAILNSEHSTGRPLKGGMFQRRGKMSKFFKRISELFRSPSHLLVVAQWDPEAQVWYVSESDVPGLVTEAESVEALLQRLDVMIPELLELNNAREVDEEKPPTVPFELLVRQHHLAHLGC